MKYLSRYNKRRKECPAHSICRNCEVQLIARYCHNCGQDSYAGSERTVGEILYNTMDTVFAWDNKIFKTLKYLVFYPGKLTSNFFDGRIIQYVYPAKMFWFITILFFAVITLGDGAGIGSSDKENIVVNVDIQASQDAAIGAIQQEGKDEKVEKKATASSLGEKGEEQKQKIEAEIKQDFISYIPYVMFLLVPFFALIIFILFYKKKKYYASHMIFALHFHSFVFLLWAVMVFIDNFVPDSWERIIDCIMLFVPAIYLAVALYITYRPSIPGLLWKIPLIMFTYGIVCCTILILFLLLLTRIAETTHHVVIWD